ncbi:MAG: AtpZ/AtpI family protein [Myxococcota bacterium]
MARRKATGIARYSALGIELAVSIIGCLLLGSWADARLGTDPWLTLLGIFVGSGLGLRAVIAAAGEASRDTDG